MSNDNKHHPELLALDTGGTLTDTFIVDENANYTVGKAQTTPENEVEGVVRSAGDALDHWGIDADEGIRDLKGIVYSGTAMLNRLIEREGDENIGIITNRGFEDAHRFGRGIQSWADLSLAGRLHAREHEHPEPIVPRENIRGVRERTNQHGEALIPPYEDEICEAVHDLLDRDVRVICVCLLYSYKDASSEQRVKEVATEIIEDRGLETPVWLSSEHNPIRGELPRLNTLVLEAYAVEPSRKQFYNLRDAFRERGAEAPFRILTSSGETVSPDHEWLADSMISGPIGGVFGSEFLADELGISNLVCSDVGGTTFEVGLITKGHYPTRWEQSIGQFMVNIPMTALDSIGSGTGGYVRVDPASERIKVGPESAGHLVGVSNVDGGVTTPTVTDCSVVLGYLNPDYFLGGDIDLDVDRAKEAIRENIAGPLDQDLNETARGVLDIVELNMTNELKSMVQGMGYSPENYSLVSYGGGGPLHAAGYTRSLGFQDVLVPEWAAAFSAFGCACADYAYRYDRTIDVHVDPEPDRSELDAVAGRLTEVFDSLREEVVTAFERDGMDPDRMSFEPSIRMQYQGMLDDLEVEVPAASLEGGMDGEELQSVIERYDEEFAQVFKRAAQSPERGYTATTVIATGVAPSPKPTIPNEELREEAPSEASHKGERAIYWEDEWHDATLFEMDELVPGNRVVGPAIAESPATTMLVPPDFEASYDEHRIFHLEQTQ